MSGPWPVVSLNERPGRNFSQFSIIHERVRASFSFVAKKFSHDSTKNAKQTALALHGNNCRAFESKMDNFQIIYQRDGGPQ